MQNTYVQTLSIADVIYFDTALAKVAEKREMSMKYLQNALNG